MPEEGLHRGRQADDRCIRFSREAPAIRRMVSRNLAIDASLNA